VALSGCGQKPRKAPVIGTAYVGPATLSIRSDFPLQSHAVATVKHGDKLDIVGRRRRFIRVRTASGSEGWTDERQLLSADDMAGLRHLAERAASMPSQGQAVSYGDLNIHTQPQRLSPSFLQIKEGQKMDVLAHLHAPRADQPRPPLLPPPAKKTRPAQKKAAAKESKIPPPPMPKPPPLPKNWLELSKSNLDDDSKDEPEAEPEAKPVPTEDWSLVRAHTGQTGWTLTRRLSMAIPDEVAQYAEGHRIVSYFSLGAVDDNGAKKQMWLWTTIAGSGHPYDFDNIRVFVWAMRRHRYETAYIERNLTGFSPVLLENVDYAKGQPAGKYPGFSVCVQKKDGTRVRRDYAVLGNAVRYAGEKACEPTAPLLAETQGAAKGIQTAPEPPPAEGFAQKWKGRVKRLFGRK
jgi:hypothetical protein